MNYVYILQCADGTYYTGWTNNLAKRLAAHNSGKGAKYTKHRTPVTLVFSEIFATKSEAMGYEVALKKLTRPQKMQLIAAQNTDVDEWLDVLDANGDCCGKRPRTVVHAQGLRHAVVHLWVLQKIDEVWGVWLQQRAENRPLYPNLFDLSATGHIGAGQTPLQAVLRETQEELGLVLTEQDLHAMQRQSVQQYERGDGGFDDELVHSFVYQAQKTPQFAIGEEVSCVKWLPLSAYAQAIAGAAHVMWNEQETATSQFCCLHSKEWAAVKLWGHMDA